MNILSHHFAGPYCELQNRMSSAGIYRQRATHMGHKSELK